MKTCRIDGCEKAIPPSGATALCSMHANRVARHGDPNVVKLPPGEGWVSVNGYKNESAHGHPLRRHDRVAAGRLALFAKIGDGAHACRYCDRPLRWGQNLRAYHLDGDRTNDNAANLVPSCAGCILNRSRRVTTRGDTRMERAEVPAPQASFGTHSRPEDHPG